MHDFTPHESGAPRQIIAQMPADFFEILTRAMFNAGLSWQVVQARWPAMADALAGFDPVVLAGYDEHDIDQVLADDRVIRNRGKLGAVPVNARTFLKLSDRSDGFRGWLDSFDEYDARERALRQMFKYIGVFGAYWTRYTLEMDVPDYRDWAAARGRTVPAQLQLPE